MPVRRERAVRVGALVRRRYRGRLQPRRRKLMYLPSYEVHGNRKVLAGKAAIMLRVRHVPKSAFRVSQSSFTSATLEVEPYHMVAMTLLGSSARAKKGTATSDVRYPCRVVSS